MASETVFWLSPKNLDAARKMVCTNSPFRQDNTFTDKHHYLTFSPKVAKLFASNTGKSPDNDPFYKALNQSLSAAVTMEGNLPSHPELSGKNWRGKVVMLEFPVIVCSSFAQMYSVDFLAESVPTAVKDNFQLEVQYAYLDRHGRQRDNYFLIDVVEMEQLEKLEAGLVEDVNAAAYLASA
jgi:hypothetical protein